MTNKNGIQSVNRFLSILTDHTELRRLRMRRFHDGKEIVEMRNTKFTCQWRGFDGSFKVQCANGRSFERSLDCHVDSTGPAWGGSRNVLDSDVG